MKYLEIRKKCQNLADKKIAEQNSQYFQVKKGGYGEGDRFYGLRVPLCRQIAKNYHQLNFSNLAKLIKSPWHEERLIALVILNKKFKTEADLVFKFYLNNIERVNNWDLVDLSAYNIVGNYLLIKPKEKTILYHLIKSDNMWLRRIAIVASLSLIKNNIFSDTFKLVKLSLTDREDLIHKASGWMLREVGKRDEARLLNFIIKYQTKMPKVMLRYSLEKIDIKKSRLSRIKVSKFFVR